MGYHQSLVNERSRTKLAFAGPGASMYTYGDIPFGPNNDSVIFICVMFNINGEWQVMAIENGVVINEDTNTKIIVDDCFNWAITEDQAFLYMEAQFTMDARRRLSFSLHKSLFFPTRVEFVGIDIGIKSNMPAARKFELLRMWPKAVDVQAVASFIAFGMWYQEWIPYFELKVQPLRKITNSYKWDENITPTVCLGSTNNLHGALFSLLKNASDQNKLVE
jgi:hypothetical protein